MAIRMLTYALAAAGLTVGATAQAAAPVDAPLRSGASIDEAEHLSGSGLIPVLVAMLAILSIIVFDSDDDPVSP